MQLIIANKNYSSWSLRAWLYLTEAGVSFEETRIPLFVGQWRDEVKKYNPTGRLPALVDGDVRVWDSWAIIEYVRSLDEAQWGWPADPVKRGEAMSVAAEMHAGFLDVRNELPMNIRADNPARAKQIGDATRAQVDRIKTIWSTCLARHGGPYLFGEELCIADIAYTPVASRFKTYGIALDAACTAYQQAVLSRPAMLRWSEQARAETEHIDFIDALHGDNPLNPG